MTQLSLSILPETFAVCRADPSTPIPAPTSGSLWSVTRTNDELSIILKQEDADPSWKIESNWRAFKVEGPLDFSLTGILARLTHPLAEARISIFAVSTYDTDYLMVKEVHLSAASEVLRTSGCLIRR